MNTIIKMLLSAIIMLSVILPYSNTSLHPGSLQTFASLGWTGSLIFIALFFVAIAFYCRALERCLYLIAPQRRKASPRSVWLMFLIPYNFIEDFFIMIHLSRSLEEEARFNASLSGIKDYGMGTGMGWCMAQLLSFLPDTAGQIAGALGLILWLLHWRFIHNMLKILNPTGKSYTHEI